MAKPNESEDTRVTQDELSELQQVQIERNEIYNQLGLLTHRRIDLGKEIEKLQAEIERAKSELEAAEVQQHDRLQENIRVLSRIQARLAQKYQIPSNGRINLDDGAIVTD